MAAKVLTVCYPCAIKKSEAIKSLEEKEILMPSYKTVDGISIHYKDEGDGDKELTLLCIHGGFGNLSHWQSLVGEFSDTHRIVRMDLRGHGDSDVPDLGYSIIQYADDVAELAHYLGIRQAVVLGHSMGAVITIALSQRHPDIAGALVWVDNPMYSWEGVRSVLGPALYLIEQPSYPECMQLIYGACFHETADQSLVQKTVEGAMRTPQRVAIADVNAMLSFDALAAAKELKLPILIVRCGGHVPDDSGVSGSVQWIHKNLPQVQYAQVVGAGHFLMLEVPDQFHPMLKRFVAQPMAKSGEVVISQTNHG
ncbi:alpha/beta fold hydrolase [Chloroflexota bacterium]